MSFEVNSFHREEEEISFNQDEFTGYCNDNDFNRGRVDDLIDIVANPNNDNSQFSDLSSISGKVLDLSHANIKDPINCDDEKSTGLAANNLLDLNEESHISKSTKRPKKLTKDDLTTIPLPLFDCFYCSNEKISFQHLVKEIIKKRYLYCCSVNDYHIVNSLINSNSTNNTFNLNGNSSNNTFNQICNRTLNDLTLKLEFSKEYVYNFYDFEKSRQIITNNEFPSMKENFRPKIKYKKLIIENNTVINIINTRKISCNTLIKTDIANNFSQLQSTIMFNSQTAILKEDGLSAVKEKEVIPSPINFIKKEEVLLDNEPNFLNFLKFDTKRKIKFSDLSFDSSVHDIYDPKFSSDEEDSKDQINLSIHTINQEQEQGLEQIDDNQQISSNVRSLFFSNSELLSLDNTSINIKNENILINQFLDEKSVNTNKAMKLNFPTIEYSNNKNDVNFADKLNYQSLTKKKFFDGLQKSKLPKKILDKAIQKSSYLSTNHKKNKFTKIGMIKKNCNSITDKLKEVGTGALDKEFSINKSVNKSINKSNNNSNFSSLLFLNDNTKQFLFTNADDNFSTKYKDCKKKLSFTRNRENTPTTIKSKLEKPNTEVKPSNVKMIFPQTPVHKKRINSKSFKDSLMGLINNSKQIKKNVSSFENKIISQVKYYNEKPIICAPKTPNNLLSTKKIDINNILAKSNENILSPKTPHNPKMHHAVRIYSSNVSNSKNIYNKYRK